MNSSKTDHQMGQERQSESGDQEMASQLLGWYDAHRRILPWREDPTPYHVWLSEIMLQQTRVEAVKAYYARFLAALPDIAALAGADEETLLKLWEGLGYYSRVRNLHKAAVQIMEEYHGEMPHTAAELRRLPGIGPYTSAAIASIAFGEPVPAVDGNFLRVFARVTRYAENIKADPARKAAGAYFTEQISKTRPGDYNQAMMDLGATVCIPNGTPLCGECPWAEYCLAHKEMPGEEDSLPVMPQKAQRPVVKLTVFLIHPEGSGRGEEINAAADGDENNASAGGGRLPDGSCGIVIHKRPAEGLLAGLWEFPNTEGFLSPAEAMDYLRREGFIREDRDVLEMRPLPAAKHLFTHREWQMQGYEVWIRGGQTGEAPPDSTAQKESIPVLSAGTPSQTAGGWIVTDLTGLRTIYSIPSAFAAYEKLLYQRHGSAVE